MAREGEHTLMIRMEFRPSDEFLTEVPDVHIAVGDSFEVTLPGNEFKTRGGRYVFRSKSGATWTAVLDPSVGRLSVMATHLDLGSFDEGLVPVKISVEMASISFNDVPVLMFNGKTLGL